MKENESLYSEERQRQVLEILKEKKRVTVRELGTLFNISGVTIRNDLNTLSRIDGVVRTHGGAIFVEQFKSEFPETEFRAAQYELNWNCGEAVAKLISNGDVVFLDARLTSASLLDSLQQKRGITVITDSIQAALQLANTSNLQVIIVGGHVQSDSRTVRGTAVDVLLGGGNISKAFFGAWGFSFKDGLTDNDPQSILLKKNVAKSSRMCVGVLDSSCWNNVSFNTFLETERIDAIITDSVPIEILQQLEERGIRAIQTGNANVAGPTGSRKPYGTYERYRSSAVNGSAYPGQPGRSMKLAFANCSRKPPFCISLEENILEQAKLAGFKTKDILLLDNEYDPETGMKNAEHVLSRSPNIFVEFQMSFKVNNIIASKFENSGIPIVAVEIPVPGTPYIGVNNWQSAVMAGEAAARLVNERWGGWDQVDLVVLFQLFEGGEAAMLRSEGFADVLDERFGVNTEEKIVRVDIGTGKQEELKRQLDKLLDEYPGARRFVLTSITESSMAAIVQQLQEMGRWNAEDYIIVTHGCDRLTQQYIRQGLYTAAIAHFPEKYGEYVIPAVCTLLDGEAVPPYVFVENVTITRDNIDRYYQL